MCFANTYNEYIERDFFLLFTYFDLALLLKCYLNIETRIKLCDAEMRVTHIRHIKVEHFDCIYTGLI